MTMSQKHCMTRLVLNVLTVSLAVVFDCQNLSGEVGTWSELDKKSFARKCEYAMLLGHDRYDLYAHHLQLYKSLSFIVKCRLETCFYMHCFSYLRCAENRSCERLNKQGNIRNELKRKQLLHVAVKDKLLFEEKITNGTNL